MKDKGDFEPEHQSRCEEEMQPCIESGQMHCLCAKDKVSTQQNFFSILNWHYILEICYNTHFFKFMPNFIIIGNNGENNGDGTRTSLEIYNCNFSLLLVGVDFAISSFRQTKTRSNILI